MSQLDLLSFINTHPSPAEPGQGGNINFWITTGSSGEFFVNGITIPLESQESTLATVISQAESIEFKLPTVNLEGYTFSNDTTNATVAGVTGYTRVSFNNSSLSNVNKVYLNGDGLTDYSGSISKWSELAISSSSISFISSTKKVTFSVSDVTYNPGMSDYFTLDVYNPQGTLFADNEPVRIRLNAGPADISDDYNSTDYFYSEKIRVKEKIISGSSLFHYYLLFQKPINIRYYEIANTTVETFPIVFNPSLTSTFKYSEYEVIGNDIQQSRKSNNLLKVDRLNSQANPSNLVSIISSSVTNIEQIQESLFGDVQDSSYGSFAWKNARYDGSKLVGSQTLPSALYVSPFNGLIFDSNLSGSKLAQAITAKIGVQAQGEELFYYTPSKTTGFVERFEISQSIESSLPNNLEETKITVFYYSGSSGLKNVSQDEKVTLQFSITKNNKESYIESRELTIPSGNSSGSLNWISYRRSTYRTGFLGFGRVRTIITRDKFVRVLETTLPFVDINFDPTFPSYDSNSIIPGTTRIYEFNNEGRFLVGVEGKKVYNVSDGVIYETSTDGTIIDIDDDDSITT